MVHHSAAHSWLWSAMLVSAHVLVKAQDGQYGAYGGDSELGIACNEGEQPALLHAFGGVYDEGAFNPNTTGALSDEYNAVLDFAAGIAGLPVSAVSTVADADPASPSFFTAGTFGGFLLFTDVPGLPTSPVEGLEAYWASEPHVAFGPSYVATVSLDEDGRGAASVQLPLCIPADLEGLGEYHMAIVVDVAAGDHIDSEACRGTLVDTLNAIAATAADTAGVPGFCARQWASWETFSFAAGIGGFDFNKKNSADDVGCVYNFDSASARDIFVSEFETLWERAADTSIDGDECVGEFWAWKLE